MIKLILKENHYRRKFTIIIIQNITILGSLNFHCILKRLYEKINNFSRNGYCSFNFFLFISNIIFICSTFKDLNREN